MKRSLSVPVRALVAGLGWVALALGAGAAQAATPLVPPQPYVLAPDGVTRLTLEQAGILNPKRVSGKTGREWAIVLGKALFWDVQAGSDGNACGSCHFHAGADTRLQNQLSPGLNDLTAGPGGDDAFGSARSDTGEVLAGRMPSGATADSNYTLVPEDLPLHQLDNERDRNSPIRTTTNDRVSSLGAFDADFVRVLSAIGDSCAPADDSVFHAGDFAARQVEPRNTPTIVNAGFFHRNFWDARANNLFTGVGVFGMRDVLGDPDKRLIVLDDKRKPQLGHVEIEDASLASQAVGPPISALEMSCAGRTFADLGKKLLPLRALQHQLVDRTDSVLGRHALTPPLRGLASLFRYSTLVQFAFDKKYWGAPGRYVIEDGALVSDPTGYRQMEVNLPLFWGVSIMLYELSLVSDRCEVDDLIASGRLLFKPAFVPAGPNIGGCTSPTGDVDPLLLRGCTIFARFTVAGAAGAPPADGIRGGNCFVCHNSSGGGGVGRPVPPLLSQAARQNGEEFDLMIEVAKNLGGNHRHDQGSMSVGLRPVFTDLLGGGLDPYGNPLSFSRQFQQYLQAGNDRSLIHDPLLLRAIDAGEFTGIFAAPAATLGVDGAVKSPILRNVALTPPYFSWGGYPSLRQALKFYNRGGNRRDIQAGDGFANRAPGTGCTSGDDTGTGPDGGSTYPLPAVADCNTNTTAAVLPLGLLDCDPDPVTGLPPAACIAAGKDSTNDDLAALERFLKALTDRRVQCAQAPFDRPELPVLAGHHETDVNADGKADDRVFVLPQVGAAGYPPHSQMCIPNAGDLFAPGMQVTSGGAGAPLD